MNVKSKKKNKGFTIIELVAVMAIMAILAAVLIPNVTGYITEARKFEVIQQARKVIIGVEAVEIKTPNLIDEKNDKIKVVVDKSAGLVIEADVNLLNPTVNTIQDCYNIINSENYTFTITSDKKLDKVTQITH